MNLESGPSSDMQTFDNWNGEQQSADDLGRKFNNTYVKASHGGATSVIYVHGFQEHHTLRPSIGFTCGNDGSSYTKLVSEVGIIQPLPPTGIYSLGDKGQGIAVVRRLPARQWHEGLYKGNTHILINGEKDMKANIPYDMARALFADQQDISMPVGLAMVEKGKSLRLTDRLWLKRDTKGLIQLFSMTRRMGSWAEGEFFWARSERLSARVCEMDIQEELDKCLA